MKIIFEFISSLWNKTKRIVERDYDGSFRLFINTIIWQVFAFIFLAVFVYGIGVIVYAIFKFGGHT